MSKNLEREYRALVNSEAPDLWARIEVGLEEKKMAPDHFDTSNVPNEDVADLHIRNSRSNGLRNTKVSFKVWAGLVAACLCVALTVPAMTRTVRMGGSSSSNAAPDFAAQYSAGAYEKADSAEQIAEAAYEDSIDEAAADNAGSINSIIASDGIYVTPDTKADTTSAAGPVAEEEGQGLYRFMITAEILDAEVRTSGGIIYTAKVIASENPDIQADSEIKIFSSAVPSEGAAALNNAQTYDLMVCENNSDDSIQEAIYILVNDAGQ